VVGKWEEFQHRYFVELEVTLLYSARDIEHNNAVALKQYLEK
jgi:uncharacterized protein YeaO (DUF488 family)